MYNMSLSKEVKAELMKEMENMLDDLDSSLSEKATFSELEDMAFKTRQSFGEQLMEKLSQAKEKETGKDKKKDV